MEAVDYPLYVQNLEERLQTLQSEYISRQNDNAQLIGPLLAITMLVRSDLLTFAQERYAAIMGGPQWKIAEDHVLELRDEVELMLTGPAAFQKRKVG